jgi:hypothetical protein
MRLIYLKRKKPQRMLFNEAIILRLRNNHPRIPIIEQDNGKRESGFYGEQKLDSMLNQYLPEKEYTFLNDLWLPCGNSHFQIDSFVATPTCLIDVETKNMKGEITLKRDYHQMIQTYDDTKNGYEDPLLQAQFQVRQLKEFLRKYHFPVIPIEYLVMMSHPNTILKTENYPEAQFRLCRGRQVIYRIEDLTKKYHLPLDRDLIRKLYRLLIKKQVKPSLDIEKIYKIPRSDLLTGVHCPSCRYLGMIYCRGSWHCPQCKCKSANAHLAALHDYYLLYGHTITNQQFREFLRIPSMKTASKMLVRLDLPHSGCKKQRVYQLLPEIFEPILV